MRGVALLGLLLVAVACSDGESRSEMVVRVRSEVYVEYFGGDVDALIELCSVDATAPEDFDPLVAGMTEEALEGMLFACPVLGEQVAAAIE